MAYGFGNNLLVFFVLLNVFLTAYLLRKNDTAGFIISQVFKTTSPGNLSTSGNDKLLDGLLSSEIEEESCHSRYQSFLYRKHSTYKPSSYLISKLRDYEKRHKRCGPNTESYKRTLELIKSGKPGNVSDCNYVVWMALSGLGNRMLTLASSFLYALLTDRVLLVDQEFDMPDLFCEPFPNTSWFLPTDFPINRWLRDDTPFGYGNILKKNMSMNSSTELPWVPAVYVYLCHDSDDYSRTFYYGKHEDFLGKVPWMIIKSNNYFAPAFFSMPSYTEELDRLFPDKETVFHHLSRYLFHPTNQVWGLVTRYYKTYLQRADERVGIQIRIFQRSNGVLKHVMDRIVNCTIDHKLLPAVDETKPKTSQTNNQLKAVFVTSLVPGYFDELKNKYWRYETWNGEMIALNQGSRDEIQKTGENWHDMKAWAEINLLSFSDVLVTSYRSTFGYIAQGLGGLKPWIMPDTIDKVLDMPSCRRVMSMEPCFMDPPRKDSEVIGQTDFGKAVPFLRHCEDAHWGYKMAYNDSSF